jgi:ABC-type transport system involved in multi-copper enzyme maturation permease subunit
MHCILVSKGIHGNLIQEMNEARELTDRLHPMTVKELQQGMRRASFVYPFLGIHILAIAAMAMEFSLGSVSRNEYPGILNLWMLVESGPFWNVVAFVCGVAMPLGGLILMGQELEEGNHELLLLTKLDRWAVVKGKFLILWSICALSLVSLLPYVVVRYFIGGVELMQELMCGLSVLGCAAVCAAGAIGASSFCRIGGRIGIVLLFVGSFLCSAFVSLFFCAMVTHKLHASLFTIFFNLNGLGATFCYVVLGLALARSRLRLVVHAFEVKPSWLVIGLLFFTPFVVCMCTAMTAAFAGFVGLIGMALVGIYADITPKARHTPPLRGTALPTIPPLTGT